MIFKIQKILGLEKLHPEVQYFLDYANLSIARPCSIIVMVVEIAAFINTFFYQIKEGQDPAKWLFYHRALYILLFLAASQLLIYSMYHKIKKEKFSRVCLDLSIVFFIMILLLFSICISITDYISNEQILVYVTAQLFIACLFMIKPYIAIPLIIIPSIFFYSLMKFTVGVSGATKINFTIIVIFFALVNIVRYSQYLKVAKNNVINHTLAEQLRNSSRYDFLTKLKNRNALNMDFEDSENENLNSSFIVMLTDLDNFKTFNDTNGHHYGDELLKKFAFILQSNFGKKHCYRYGGDEYLIVMPEIDKEKFLQKIKDCEAKINDAFHFSAGYTRGFVSSSKDLHLLINQADKNLYEAKGSGKNMVIGNFL